MIGHYAALIYTMVLVAASDGELNDAELTTMGTLVETLPAFKGYKSDHLSDTTEDCATVMGQDNGLEKVLEQIQANTPAKLAETAYLIACEVAAADHALRQEELRVLELLRHRLDIDRLHAAAIERAVRARFAHL